MYLEQNTQCYVLQLTEINQGILSRHAVKQCGAFLAHPIAVFSYTDKTVVSTSVTSNLANLVSTNCQRCRLSQTALVLTISYGTTSHNTVIQQHTYRVLYITCYTVIHFVAYTISGLQAQKNKYRYKLHKNLRLNITLLAQQSSAMQLYKMFKQIHDIILTMICEPGP